MGIAIKGWPPAAQARDRLATLLLSVPIPLAAPNRRESSSLLQKIARLGPNRPKPNPSQTKKNQGKRAWILLD
jgi:hypothetical protein